MNHQRIPKSAQADSPQARAARMRRPRQPLGVSDHNRTTAGLALWEFPGPESWGPGALPRGPKQLPREHMHACRLARSPGGEMRRCARRTLHAQAGPSACGPLAQRTGLARHRVGVAGAEAAQGAVLPALLEDAVQGVEDGGHFCAKGVACRQIRRLVRHRKCTGARWAAADGQCARGARAQSSTQEQHARRRGAPLLAPSASASEIGPSARMGAPPGCARGSVGAPVASCAYGRRREAKGSVLPARTCCCTFQPGSWLSDSDTAGRASSRPDVQPHPRHARCSISNQANSHTHAASLPAL